MLHKTGQYVRLQAIYQVKLMIWLNNFDVMATNGFSRYIRRFANDIIFVSCYEIQVYARTFWGKLQRGFIFLPQCKNMCKTKCWYLNLLGGKVSFYHYLVGVLRYSADKMENWRLSYYTYYFPTFHVGDTGFMIGLSFWDVTEYSELSVLVVKCFLGFEPAFSASCSSLCYLGPSSPLIGGTYVTGLSCILPIAFLRD